ncbi:hypothetical protein [Runella sp.]|uniref:hypothetical protein n=1 Tax=Runella sp. TaxID=1960881 RepID=UPI003D0C7C27
MALPYVNLHHEAQVKAARQYAADKGANAQICFDSFLDGIQHALAMMNNGGLKRENGHPLEVRDGRVIQVLNLDIEYGPPSEEDLKRITIIKVK